MTTAQTTRVGGLGRTTWNPKIFGMAAGAVAVALVAAFLVTSTPTAEPIDVGPGVSEQALARSLEAERAQDRVGPAVNEHGLARTLEAEQAADRQAQILKKDAIQNGFAASAGAAAAGPLSYSTFKQEQAKAVAATQAASEASTYSTTKVEQARGQGGSESGGTTPYLDPGARFKIDQIRQMP